MPPNLLAAWHLANAGVAGIVAKNHHIPREKRRVRSRKIEQHAVTTRHRDNLHFCNLASVNALIPKGLQNVCAFECSP